MIFWRYIEILAATHILLWSFFEPGKFECSGTEFMHYCEQAGFIKLPFDDRHIVVLETLEKKENTPTTMNLM